MQGTNRSSIPVKVTASDSLTTNDPNKDNVYSSEEIKNFEVQSEN